MAQGRLFVDANGNVGIANSSPTNARLLVGDDLGAITTAARMVQVGHPSGGMLILGKDNTDYSYLTHEASTQTSNWFYRGGAGITLNSAGLVGVGTSGPSSQLDVRGSATDFDGLRVLNTNSGSGTQTSAAIRLGITNSFGAVNGIRNCRIQATENNADANEVHLDFYTNSAVGLDQETVKMRLTSGGALGIGTTSPGVNLEIGANDDSVKAFAIRYSTVPLYISNSFDGSSGLATFSINNYNTSSGSSSWSSFSNVSYGSSAIQLASRAGASGADIRFLTAVTNNTNPTEHARIDSSGRLLVGTTAARSNFFNTASSAPQQLQVEGTTGNTCSLSSICSAADTSGGRLLLAHQRSGAVGGNTILNSGDQAGYITFQGNDGGQFVECASIDAQVDGTPGADDMPGRLVFSTTADGASSATERMRIASGGDIRIGQTTSDAPAAANIAGAAIGQTGYLSISRSGDLGIEVNRISNDGTLMRFLQDANEEGTISVSGTTVSYNGAHLSRWSQIPGIDPHNKVVRPEILRGTVMSNLDEMCEWTCPESGDCQDNEQLNKTKISDVEGDKNVAGIFQSWDDDDDTWVNDYYLAMTGDFVIRIAAGTTVERGDLLMSAGDGTAKPQDDDIIRSKTIAKVTSTNVSCTYDDGSYCVPCVLMAC
jgi:hypothetical protein